MSAGDRSVSQGGGWKVQLPVATGFVVPAKAGTLTARARNTSVWIWRLAFLPTPNGWQSLETSAFRLVFPLSRE